jgi:FkbM family methyltransferase
MVSIISSARSAASRCIKRIFRLFGLEITSTKRFSALEASSEIFRNLEDDLYFFRTMPEDFAEELGPVFVDSKSQLRQDIFVLWQTSLKRNGFFVEFGATNGLSLSNTFLLEKCFEWKGILVEPARIWKKQLLINRPHSYIDFGCVYRNSGHTIQFHETGLPELSTIQEFSNSDFHSNRRKNFNTYEVKSISLEDLLHKYHAPRTIDYLSVDTEGSEYEILRDFDFGKYIFSIITVEHNYTSNREKLFDLLVKNGYTRVLTEISKFDDWYVHESLKAPH